LKNKKIISFAPMTCWRHLGINREQRISLQVLTGIDWLIWLCESLNWDGNEGKGEEVEGFSFKVKNYGCQA